jgi:hypothetical protein
LTAGDARDLFSNYRVSNQSPVAGERVPVVGRTRSPVVSLTVWGVQGPPQPPCTPSAGWTVLASSPAAVIAQSGSAWLRWWGCVRTIGIWHLLKANDVIQGSGYDTSVKQTVLAGRYVAMSFLYDDKYMNCSSTVGVWDLGGSAPVQLGGYIAGCATDGMPTTIDSLTLSSAGFAAWVSGAAAPTTPINAVSCPSTTLCVATDPLGDVLTSTDPGAAHPEWSAVNIGGLTSYGSHIPLGGVSCPSIGLCVALGGAGGVFTSTNPTAGASAWAKTTVSGAPGGSLSCPSVSLCLAADGYGNLLVSKDPTGPGAWTSTKIGDGAALKISCASASLCIATDDVNLLISTDPIGGQSAWSSTQPAVPPGTDGITAAACASTTLCVAGGGAGELLTTTDPTTASPTWTRVPSPAPSAGIIRAISCPSTTFCVAIDQKGNLLTSSDPNGGASAWNLASVDPAPAALGPSLSDLSCLPGLCVAVDRFGGAFASTNPLAQPPAWTNTPVDAPSTCTASPCLVQQLYAVDHEGTQLVDQPPAGAGNTIADLALSGNVLTWTDNGQPKQATLP